MVTQTAKDYNRYWQERSLYRPLGNYTPAPAQFDIGDSAFQFSGNYRSWPWANDPCNVLYNKNDGLYYSWILYRDHTGDGFPTDWMEMVSEDCINWRQTEKRLIRGVHATTPWNKPQDAAFMGGSVWLDKNNRFGFGYGAALFLVSMNTTMINGARGNDQSVALFVAPKGLGTPIEQRLSRYIFAVNPTGTDWRDTRMQWDEEHNQLLFVISNRSRVQIYANKTTDISKFKRMQIFASGYPSGIECPEFHPIIDSVTGVKYWLLTAAKQVPQGGKARPEQTTLWYSGIWNGKTFSSVRRGVLEYGQDFYAQSVSEPQQNDNPTKLLMRGYMGNWGYTPDITNWPSKGFVGGCFEDRELYLENGEAKTRPLIKFDDLPVLAAPPSAAPVGIRVKFYDMTAADKRLNSFYRLRWSSGDTVDLNFGQKLSFNIGGCGSLVLPGKAFAPMPVTYSGDMDIIINGCCLSFYIDGKQAGFQIFPRGDFEILEYVSGVLKTETVTYYDLSPFFV